MELIGKVVAVCEPKEGTSARTGSSWKVQEYVIETFEQYPKKCCFSLFGDDRIARFNIQAGETISVSFDIDAHEYNGRWFNSIRAWDVKRVDPQQAAAGGVAPAAPAYQPAPGVAPAAGYQPAPGAASAAPYTAPAAQPAAAAPAQPFTAPAEDSADDLPF